MIEKGLSNGRLSDMKLRAALATERLADLEAQKEILHEGIAKMDKLIQMQKEIDDWANGDVEKWATIPTGCWQGSGILRVGAIPTTKARLSRESRLTTTMASWSERRQLPEAKARAAAMKELLKEKEEKEAARTTKLRELQMLLDDACNATSAKGARHVIELMGTQDIDNQAEGTMPSRDEALHQWMLPNMEAIRMATIRAEMAVHHMGILVRDLKVRSDAAHMAVRVGEQKLLKLKQIISLDNELRRRELEGESTTTLAKVGSIEQGEEVSRYYIGRLQGLSHQEIKESLQSTRRSQEGLAQRMEDKQDLVDQHRQLADESFASHQIVDKAEGFISGTNFQPKTRTGNIQRGNHAQKAKSKAKRQEEQDALAGEGTEVARLAAAAHHGDEEAKQELEKRAPWFQPDPTLSLMPSTAVPVDEDVVMAEEEPVSGAESPNTTATKAPEATSEATPKEKASITAPTDSATTPPPTLEGTKECTKIEERRRAYQAHIAAANEAGANAELCSWGQYNHWQDKVEKRTKKGATAIAKANKVEGLIRANMSVRTAKLKLLMTQEEAAKVPKKKDQLRAEWLVYKEVMLAADAHALGLYEYAVLREGRPRDWQNEEEWLRHHVEMEARLIFWAQIPQDAAMSSRMIAMQPVHEDYCKAIRQINRIRDAALPGTFAMEPIMLMEAAANHHIMNAMGAEEAHEAIMRILTTKYQQTLPRRRQPGQKWKPPMPAQAPKYTIRPEIRRAKDVLDPKGKVLVEYWRRKREERIHLLEEYMDEDEHIEDIDVSNSIPVRQDKRARVTESRGGLHHARGMDARPWSTTSSEPPSGKSSGKSMRGSTGKPHSPTSEKGEKGGSSGKGKSKGKSATDHRAQQSPDQGDRKGKGKSQGKEGRTSAEKGRKSGQGKSQEKGGKRTCHQDEREGQGKSKGGGERPSFGQGGKGEGSYGKGGKGKGRGERFRFGSLSSNDADGDRHGPHIDPPSRSTSYGPTNSPREDHRDGRPSRRSRSPPRRQAHRFTERERYGYEDARGQPRVFYGRHFHESTRTPPSRRYGDPLQEPRGSYSRRRSSEEDDRQDDRHEEEPASSSRSRHWPDVPPGRY